MGIPRIDFRLTLPGASRAALAGQLTESLDKAATRTRRGADQGDSDDRGMGAFAAEKDARDAFDAVKALMAKDGIKGRVTLIDCGHSDLTGEPNQPCTILDVFDSNDVGSERAR